MLYDPKWKNPEAEVRPLEVWQQILIGAAYLIERYGWVQDMYGDQHHGFCTIGAIEEATQAYNRSGFPARPVSNDKAIKSVEAVIRVFSSFHSKSEDIVGWNDTVGRTKQEVLETLRKAAHVV